MDKDSIVISGGMTAARLKWIAIITMLIDHVGASLVESAIYNMSLGPQREALRNLDACLRCIGRLAFPLFIFLMVEGFFYTRSRAKYLMRLVLFAAVSEFPFDLALFLQRSNLDNQVYMNKYHQNVFFTLAIGFAVIWLMEWLRPKLREYKTAGNIAEAAARLALCGAAVWAGCRLADYLHTDYSWKGVLAMALAYLIRLAGRTDLEIFGMLAALLFSSRLELAAIFDYELIRRYYGEKGKTVNRWFFYLFYPGHLLVLGILRFLFILPK